MVAFLSVVLLALELVAQECPKPPRGLKGLTAGV
jgi:hypothetical protein